jgi:geranylgeranylglyceryl phosphate synthase family protein
MSLIYLEAGSGAKKSVPHEMVNAIKDYISLPLIVGGGIRTPKEAENQVKAGASFIVTGNVLESRGNWSLINEFAEAIHQ